MIRVEHCNQSIVLTDRDVGDLRIQAYVRQHLPLIDVNGALRPDGEILPKDNPAFLRACDEHFPLFLVLHGGDLIAHCLRLNGGCHAVRGIDLLDQLMERQYVVLILI